MRQQAFPSAAEEELADTMTLEDYLIKNKEATFILKVASDSMERAGILEGDMVLVERGRKPLPGRIVVVRKPGEDFTLEYFGSTTTLHLVEAVVVGVVHRY